MVYSRKATGRNKVAPLSALNFKLSTLYPANSFIYRTYKIFACKSFSCRTYKNKGLITPLFATHTKNMGVYPLRIRTELSR